MLPAQSPNDTVRVAFIGVGNRGSFLLGHMLKMPGIQVIAICDIDPQALKRAIAAAGARADRGGPSPMSENLA